MDAPLSLAKLIFDGGAGDDDLITVLIKRCDKAILQLGYFISNLEQHTLDESKVDSAAITLRIRLASIRHVRRVW